MIPAEAIERFRADFQALGDWGAPLHVAVSGGADSLALLLLAHAAFRGRVRAATVDHGLRPESALEAVRVGDVCAALGVPHETLAPGWDAPPHANIQARARTARYRALQSWAARGGKRWVTTAHHLDDQAETLLMRLARGAGVAGLAGVRPRNDMHLPGGTLTLLRPLLGWRKAELVGLLASTPFQAAEDPSNDDQRFDRTQARRLLAETPWLEPERVAASAAHLAECAAALDWATQQVRVVYDDAGTAEVDAAALPPELQRRIVVQVIQSLAGVAAPPGPKVMRLLAGLNSGKSGMLADMIVHPGPPWRFERAPPRKS